jgi:hypothetical protein
VEPLTGPAFACISCSATGRARLITLVWSVLLSSAATLEPFVTPTPIPDVPQLVQRITLLEPVMPIREAAPAAERAGKMLRQTASVVATKTPGPAITHEAKLLAPPVIYAKEPDRSATASASPARPAPSAGTSAPAAIETHWDDYVARGKSIGRVPSTDVLMSSFEPYRLMLQHNRIVLVFSKSAQLGEQALFWQDGEDRPRDGYFSEDMAPLLRRVSDPGATPELSQYAQRAREYLELRPGEPLVVHVLYSRELRWAVLGKLAVVIEQKHHRSIEDAARVTFRLEMNSASTFDVELESVRFRR